MHQTNLMRNAFYNSLRQCAAIIIPLITFTHCSRVLGADALGKASYAQSIVSYFLLIAALGIREYAIREGAVLRDNKKELSIFLNEIFSLNCITTVIAYILLAGFLLISDGSDDHNMLIMIYSLQIMMATLGVDWINSVFEDYRYLAIRYVTTQICVLILILLRIRSENDIYAYAFLMVSSTGISSVINRRYLKRKIISLKLTYKINIRKHLPSIMVLFACSVASVIYLNSDITLLGVLTSDKDVGIYSVSTKIYTVAKAMVNAVVMVTVPRFSYILKNESMEVFHKELKKVIEMLMALTVPCIVGLYLVAEELLYIVFGAEYSIGSDTLQILSIAMLFGVGACVMTYSILIPNYKEKHFLGATTLAALVNLSLNFFFIPRWGIKGAALTTLFAEAITFGLTAFFAKRWLEIKLEIKNITSVIIAALFIPVVNYLCHYRIADMQLAFYLTVSISILVYVICLVMMKNDTALGVFEKIVKWFKR